MKPKVKILCFGVAMIVLIACNQNQNNQNKIRTANRRPN